MALDAIVVSAEFAVPLGLSSFDRVASDNFLLARHHGDLDPVIRPTDVVMPVSQQPTFDMQYPASSKLPLALRANVSEFFDVRSASVCTCRIRTPTVVAYVD